MPPHDPWKQLGPDNAKRVDADGQYDFFWVVLEAGAPGLMLQLPAIPQPVPRRPKLKNLEISFHQVAGGVAFVLSLKERSQVEIFKTLCYDVVSAGEAGENLDDALSRVIQRTRRWRHLLRGGRPDGLTVEEQRGLVGELAFLRDLVSGLGPETAMEAWTGPTGSVKDFELIGTCVEVKTRRVAARPFVGISSEDQLADVEGSRLFLHVVNVASAVLPDGLSLHDHVRHTAELFEKSGIGLNSWEDAIWSTGYDPDNDYDGRRWLVGAVTDYEVVPGFPRIASPLPTGVDNVRYALSLNACNAFRFEGDLVATIRETLGI